MSPFAKFEVLRYRSLFIGLSVALLVASFVGLVTKGLNFGIDFTGGTLLERRLGTAVTSAAVRSVLEGPALAHLDLSGSVVQPLDDPRDVLIRTRALESPEIAALDEALQRAFGGVQVLRTEFVGPVIGEELINRALLALAISAALVLVYLSVRFEFTYAAVAVLAVLHDVAVMMGAMAWLGRELNTPFIAAVLTILGYSLNATIVVFDRIRENVRLRKRESLNDVVNRSVRETMARSINTSLTTLLVLVALWWMGGAAIRDFALSLIVGVVAGAYSSTFVAGPVWSYWQGWSEQRRRGTSRASAETS